jgi:hypothetical protein
LLVDITFNVAEVLGIAGISEGFAEQQPIKDEDRRLGNPDAGCEICGAPYAGPWIAARTWRCAAHPPGPEHYRRNR